jgi:hypothetical protein
MAQDDPLKDVLSMLTTEQIHTLRTALGQHAGAAAGRKVLSEQQINTLKSEAANYRQAQKQAAEAMACFGTPVWIWPSTRATSRASIR